MRSKLWVASIAAILGMVGTAPAQVVYSISTDQSTYTGATGSTVLVTISLNETLSNGATSLINNPNTGNGLFGFGLGVSNNAGLSATSSNALINAAALGSAAYSVANGATAAAAQVSTANTSSDNKTDYNKGNKYTVAGAAASFQWTAGISSTGLYAPPGSGTIGTSSYPSTTASGSIVLGTVTITIGTGTDVFTIGNAFYPSKGQSDGAPIASLNDTSNIAYGAQGANGDTYTGFMDGGPITFTVKAMTVGTPEPGSLALCGLALSGVGFGAWRRRKSATTTETETAQDAAV